METLSPISFQQLFLIFCLILAAFPAAHATQTMPPEEYHNAPNVLAPEIQARKEPNSTRKTSFAYFTNWGIYSDNFQPSDIRPATLTHVLYAFADTDPSNGTVRLTDSYADETNHFPGDSWTESGNNLYGSLKQLYMLKLKQRGLKVLLSIGGWNYSQAGHFNFVTRSSARSTFVRSAIRLIEDYGFDGIDLDYEYPGNLAQGQGLADLISELRTAFDKLRDRKGDLTPYLITAAVAATSERYANYKVAQMNAALDYWNIMAYDYAGSWLAYSDNQANLYGGQRTGSQTDAAVKWYLAHGASSAKINLGIPLYGRAFENTKGLGLPYRGVGPGIYSYKALPLTGAQVFENATDVSSFSYDTTKRELISFDTPNVVKLKAQYIKSRGLAGSMFWELSGDKVGRNSLVETAVTILGPLDQTPNHIHYPNSKWDNIRNNMAPGTTSGTGLSKTTTQKPKTTQLTPMLHPNHTTTDTRRECAGFAAWSSTTAYDQGTKVVYGAHLWLAKWWTQGDVPGGAAGVWTDNGVC